jgi:metal transporter CNNM
VIEEGEPVDEKSIIRLPTKVDLTLIPQIARDVNDPSLLRVHASGHHWVVLTDMAGEPRLLLDADGALRAALLDRDAEYDIYNYCRRPLVIKDSSKTLAEVIGYLKTLTNSLPEDGAIDYDAVLIRGDNPRIDTGADVLGKLLKGITPEHPGMALRRLAPRFKRFSIPPMPEIGPDLVYFGGNGTSMDVFAIYS